MTSVVIVKDSTNWLGSRLTTLVLTYPRYIHAEFMTHRVLSKNSASSRAIPVNKIIDSIINDTVYPIWTKNQKGMQGEIIVENTMIDLLNEYVKIQRDTNIGYVQTLSTLGVHKQNANRYLEPFQYIKVICTGTEWQNFFDLRIHEDAQPEIKELATCIKMAMDKSTPRYLEPGDWHIPFADRIDYNELIKQTGFLIAPDNKSNKISDQELKISVARCARISYLTFDGEINYKKDLELYNNLVSNNPKHLSPTEHQARVPTLDELSYFHSGYQVEHDFLKEGDIKVIHRKGKYISNLEHWIQYRKIIENETYG